MEEKGYITICFSIVLLLIFSLLSTTIESARLTAVHMRCFNSAFLGLESTFADYSIPVLKKYGLLCLDKTYGTENPEEIVNYLKKYIENQASPNKDLWLHINTNGTLGGKASDFYPVHLEEIEILSDTNITEKGGEILEKEILEYMKDAVPADIIENILEQMNILEKSKTVTKIFDKIAELEEKASAVDKAIQNIDYGLKKLGNLHQNFYTSTEKLQNTLDKLEEIKKLQMQAETKEEEISWQVEIEYFEHQISSQIKDIIKEQETLLEQTESILQWKENYMQNTKLVQEELTHLKNTYREEVEELDITMNTALKEELEDISIYSGGKGDYYQVEKTGDSLEKNQALLKETIYQLNNYTKEGKTKGLKEILKQYEANMQDYKKESLFLNYENKPVTKETGDFLNTIKKIKQNGILALVIEETDNLSNKSWKIEKYEERKKEKLEKKDIFTNTIENIVINEYVQKKFGSFTNTIGHTVLDYEVEYILSGKDSDRENLKKTVEKILAIREGLNLIYLMQDTKKKTEAETLAIALVGFTGIYGIVKVTQFLILAAWAFAEAITDVKTLLEGGKIELWKTNESWNISLEGLKNWKGNDIQNAKRTKGLSYKDYLRVLLFFTNEENRNYRMMDLIQENIRKQSTISFSLEFCISDMEIKSKFTAEPIFFTLSFMKEFVKGARNYEIEGNSRYSYRKQERK